MTVLTQKRLQSRQKNSDEMVMTKGEGREASEENRGREARSGKRRQFEQDRVGVGASSRAGCEREEPHQKVEDRS